MLCVRVSVLIHKFSISTILRPRAANRSCLLCYLSHVFVITDSIGSLRNSRGKSRSKAMQTSGNVKGSKVAVIRLVSNVQARLQLSRSLSLCSPLFELLFSLDPIVPRTFRSPAQREVVSAHPLLEARLSSSGYRPDQPSATRTLEALVVNLGVESCVLASSIFHFCDGPPSLRVLVRRVLAILENNELDASS